MSREPGVPRPCAFVLRPGEQPGALTGRVSPGLVGRHLLAQRQSQSQDICQGEPGRGMAGACPLLPPGCAESWGQRLRGAGRSAGPGPSPRLSFSVLSVLRGLANDPCKSVSSLAIQTALILQAPRPRSRFSFRQLCSRLQKAWRRRRSSPAGS